MAIFNTYSSSIHVLGVSKSFIGSSSVHFQTNSLYMNYGLGQGSNPILNIDISSHAEGYNNSAAGNSHAEGYNNSNTAATSYSHAEGYNNFNRGSYNHIEGYNNTQGTATITGYSHIEGYNNNPKGFQYSHIEGINNSTTSSTYHAHIEGANNIGQSAGGSTTGNHIEGYNNQIDRITIYNGTSSLPFNAEYAHVEGAYNLGAHSNYSHTEGSGSIWFVDGNVNHIEGSNHFISNSFTQWGGTRALHILGRNNQTYGNSRIFSTNGSTGSILIDGLITGIDNVCGSVNTLIIGTQNTSFLPGFIYYTGSLVPSSSINFCNILIGKGLSILNSSSDFTTAFGHYNSTLSIGLNARTIGYTIIGGGKSNNQRANIMEAISRYPTSSILNELILFSSRSSDIAYFPQYHSLLTFPGVSASGPFASNTAAIAAGVPVGGLYRSLDSFNGTNNNISIVTGSS